MNAANKPTSPDDPFDPNSVEALLPWYAAGTLSADEKKIVDEALARDPALRTLLILIEEERDEVIHASEQIAAPSHSIADKMFSAIAEEASAVGGQRALKPDSSWLTRFGRWLAGFSPAGLGLAGAAALAVIGVQAGVFALLTVDRSTDSTYQTASGQHGDAGGGFILAAFQPTATLDAVTRLLDEHGVRIIEGPLPGGIFRLRVLTSSPDEVARITAALQGDPIVKFTAPAPEP